MFIVNNILVIIKTTIEVLMIIKGETSKFETF